jgi:hypothetical protein
MAVIATTYGAQLGRATASRMMPVAIAPDSAATHAITSAMRTLSPRSRVEKRRLTDAHHGSGKARPGGVLGNRLTGAAALARPGEVPTDAAVGAGCRLSLVVRSWFG